MRHALFERCSSPPYRLSGQSKRSSHSFGSTGRLIFLRRESGDCTGHPAGAQCSFFPDVQLFLV
eukprot:763927-Hanusia_phi.AAC.1